MMIFRKLARASALFLFLALPQATNADLVVLQYHHVDDSTPPATSTSVSLFEAQLQMISDLGLEVVNLNSGTTQALSDTATDINQIAITFDDAYESVYTLAAPILEQYQMPYTIFVSTNAVGTQGYMSWKQLEELANNRLVTIANHSADHAHLARKRGESEEHWSNRVDHSLDAAQKVLKAQLGSSETLFAYPYGEYDTGVEKKVRQRGWYGFGQHSGAIGNDSLGTRLPRFPMANAYGQLGSLKDKLLSKSFPVAASELPDSVITRNPPHLTLELSDKLSPDHLTCFASGIGRIDFTLNGSTVTVQAPRAIPGRRFRYNCTHPAGDGRFYWLSQPWLNLDAPED
ncbi:polysaccharide deacetylase family protein [Marinobacter sp.]|uniref:polysaccharide deacetylase family protein n=1 Tax=Marinobacter sp. TaxID=50741 RepID=UPI003564C7A1